VIVIKLKQFDLKSKESKQEIAYNAIKQSIINNELKPNTILVERQLSETLNISRTPVRQALLKLVNEGFVEFIPKKGMFVSEIHLSDVIEIYNIRSVLEPFILDICLENNNPEIYNLMKQNLELQERALNEGNYKMFLKHDLDFHKIYIEGSGYKILKEFLNSINVQIERLTFTTTGDEERARVSFLQHTKILDAYAQKDIDEVKATIAEHMNSIKEYYIKKLTKNERLFLRSK
jgi:DNA-binding GntR family transcriptional regulator